MKTKRISLTTKMLIIAIILLTITIISLAYLSIYRSQKAVHSLMEDRMLNITNSAAAMVNGDDLEQLVGDVSDADKPSYLAINGKLSPFFRTVGLKYIYAIKKLEGGYGVVVDPDMEAADEYGEIIETTPALEAAMAGTPSAEQEPTEDRWGNFYSSYSPVYNSKKQLVGAIGVDFEAEWFDTRKDTLDQFLILICVVTIVGSILLAWFITRKVRKELKERLVESEKLRETKDLIEQADQVKRDFLEHTTYEVRVPVHTILERNKKIMDETNVERTRLCAGNIEVAGQNLLSMINDILDYSNLEDESTALENAEYDLVELVDKLVRTIKPAAKEKGLQMVVNVDEVLPRHLSGDAGKISQCLMNLLTNAVKFTEEGSVTFSIFMMSLERNKVQIRFSVEDTGVGIHEEDMDRLFHAFERFDRDKNRTTGTGLGMAIVKRLLQLMDSELTVESLYGQGSLFSFIIAQDVIQDDPVGDYEMAASRLPDTYKPDSTETEE
ncbi:MAG: ATP-binding protein [Eubacterium sp.]|nr:ATP-binding protein [Eubacterium sp.]